jgi:sulfate permease, SulP family
MAGRRSLIALADSNGVLGSLGGGSLIGMPDGSTPPRRPAPRRLRLPVLGAILPITRSGVGADVVAGVAGAAVGIPAVLGYAKIAGMPAETGLYTLVVPLAVFAVLASSRHLVVGADSATATILAAGLTSLAPAGSPRYVALAGLASLLAGGMLLVARVIRLGFLADFLSRTVLIGFLTGVGIAVACGQLPDMLGVRAHGNGTLGKLVDTVRHLPDARPGPIAVSVCVLVVLVGLDMLPKRVPAALVAVVGAIAVSRVAHLAGHGVAVLGAVPGGLPHLAMPTLGARDIATLFGMAASLFMVILAQSSATARAYAARHDEPLDLNADLVGLGAANVAAAFTGSFVVNGSPTKTALVDSAGGRSQLAQLVTSALVLLVLLALTGPLAALPIAALAAVVFLIGVELIDVAGLRRILALRRPEFGVALITAAAVVMLGVKQGMVLAIGASMIDHLRHSYRPRSSVLVKSAAGHWQSLPITGGARTEPGLVVFRFGSSLYFANAAALTDDVNILTAGPTVQWFCVDAAAIGDVDYTAAAVVLQACVMLRERGIRLLLSSVVPEVRRQLDRYGVTAEVGTEAYFTTAGEVLEAYQQARAG